MCPLVVSEWRKTTGTNGTPTWVKSMRNRVAGIGLPQILRRADGTGVKVHVTTLSRLGGGFWIFKASAAICVCGRRSSVKTDLSSTHTL